MEGTMSIACTRGQLYATTAAASDTSDEALIQSIAGGDAQAMKSLYARHNVRVFRFVVRLVGDAPTAEDIVSEVFLEVWRQAGKFQTRSSVSTWLLAIARNKALSALRSRRPTEELEHAAEAIADPHADPEMTMQERQTSELLLGCLQRLSPAHREDIDLVYYHGRSVEEVAAIVGAAPNTVKTRMFYARKQIAQMLAAQRVDRAVV
jgi:RNA polymerase sigma-70 factor (ECF subfamily)